MSPKIAINRDGVVEKKINRPDLPSLRVTPITLAGRKLIRLHNLMSGESPTIIIRRGEGIGDLLMTTPTVRFVAEQYPTATITYATNLSYLNGALPQALRYNPYVANVVDWNNFGPTNYDVVLDLHCPCLSHEKPKAPPINRIDLFAQSIGIPVLKDPKPIYVVHPSELEWAANWLQEKMHLASKERLVIISPLASNINRSIDISLTKETIRLLKTKMPNIKILVLDHTVDFLRTIIWDGYADYVGHDLPLRELSALLSFAQLLICPDSAALHIAGALDIKTLALFGPTDANARIDHYPNAVALWPGHTLSCAPCWYESGKCSHKSCWKMITAQDVSEIAWEILAKNRIVTPAEVIQQGQMSFKIIAREIIRTEIL
jgi:ADP-heptose:LPS heptosyltransferase